MIYTTYFAQLRKLPASVLPIAVSNTVPHSCDITHIPALAPDWESIAAYKASGNRDAFRAEYFRKLEGTRAAELLQGFMQRDVALVCWEKDPATCHRALLGEWLQKQYGVGVQEWR